MTWNKYRSDTHLVKDELARPRVIGKQTFSWDIVRPQVLLTQQKRAVFWPGERERFSLRTLLHEKATPSSHCTC